MRNKKTFFKLNPEWMFKEPIDFEYNKYTLLGYLQKCEKNFEKLEIYPDFIELSLHLANVQSLTKENMLLLTNKKFLRIDDEILLKELHPKKPPKLTEEEKTEIELTIKYSVLKMYDIFNLGKSIWNMAFDSMDIKIKRNKKNVSSKLGYAFYFNKKTNTLIIWEYSVSDEKVYKYDINSKFNIIFNGQVEDKKVTTIIDETTTWNEFSYKKFPVFEVTTNQELPLNETFVPIMRRKIASNIMFFFQKER
jgi:hypothetical protein